MTIGQSPRDDIVNSMFGRDPGPMLQQFGALDDLAVTEVRNLVPHNGEEVLVSTLRSGDEVILAKARLMPHVQCAVDRAVTSGASTVCILCTGNFDAINARSATLVTVDQLLLSVVDSLLPRGTLGVLCPHPAQEQGMLTKWRSEGRRVRVWSLSPYNQAERGHRFGDDIGAADVDLMIMDCMGFDREMQDDVSSQVNCPVLLSNGVVGAVLEELLTVGSPVDHALQV
ncbi:MAG: AroM family protein [Chloroflexota bacterium]